VRDLCGPEVDAKALTAAVDELCARFSARPSRRGAGSS